MDLISEIKRWGNSYGIILPKKFVEVANLKETDKVKISVERITSIEDLFGSVQFDRTSQEIKDEMKKGWK